MSWDNRPLSASITPSLFYYRLKNYLFHEKYIDIGQFSTLSANIKESKI